MTVTEGALAMTLRQSEQADQDHGSGVRQNDVLAISNLIAESHFLVDSGRWEELADTVFVAEEPSVVPEADFGFDVWRGTEGIRQGFAAAMPRFSGAVHAVSNLHLTVVEAKAVARYYVQGWHWVARGRPAGSTNIDFLVLGVMTDDVVRQRGEWRILRRRLRRLGPDVALGCLPPFLHGLGTAGE
jgi:hypothetical protein